MTSLTRLPLCNIWRDTLGYLDYEQAASMCGLALNWLESLYTKSHCILSESSITFESPLSDLVR